MLQAASVVAMASSGQLFRSSGDVLHDGGVFPVVTMVVCMVAGTAVTMWLAELLTERGVGDGMSILVFTQVVAVFPGELWRIYRTRHGFVFTVVILVGPAIMAGVVFVEQAQRRIPVQYAKRMVGRRTTPGALYLGLVALVPMVSLALLGVGDDLPFGGTAVLIVVGVGLDTVKQIESRLQQHDYEGFLR